MPNSADKSAEFEEEGDGREQRSSMSDPDLDDLGLAIPEFRVPSKAQGFKADSEAADEDDDFEGEATRHIPPQELENELRADSGEDFEDQIQGFDRAELVKTVRMDAFDRSAVEAGSSPAWEVNGFLEDQRFAPDVLVLPPRVLTRKWQEGARLAANGAAPGGAAIQNDRDALATTVQAPAATREAANQQAANQQAANQQAADQEAELDSDAVFELDAETDAPQPEPEEFAEPPLISDDSSEALELDNEFIEEIKPPPKPMLTGAPPRDARPETARQRPNRQHLVTGPLPPQKPVASPGDDDDLSGIVQELLDEQKAKPQVQKKASPRRDDKRTNWFHDVFSEEYFRTLPKDLAKQTEREVRFIHQSLGLQKGARILDLGCGFGRHAIELGARDYEVAGLDLSMAMLQRAHSEAQRRNLPIKFIHSDMRELNFNEIFDACISWQTSFGYFDDRTNVQVAQGMARAIKPGGRLLMEVVNRDSIVSEMPSRTWWEGHECVFLEEVEFDNHTSILHTKRSFIYEDGSPPREFSSYIRLYSLHELRQLLHFAGFRVIEVSGAIYHRGSFLGPTSPKLILLAEKVPPRE